MSKILSPKVPAAPAVPPPPEAPPTVDTATAAARSQQQASDELNKRRGRAANILTSQKGDTSQPKLGASTALGF